MSSLSGKVSTGGQLDLYKAVTYGTTTTPAAATASSIAGLTLSSTSVSEYKATGTTVGLSLQAKPEAAAHLLTVWSAERVQPITTCLLSWATRSKLPQFSSYSTESSYSIRVRHR